MNKALRLVDEVERANEAKEDEQVLDADQCKKWKAPDYGVYKINTDDAVFKDQGLGLGGVARDHEGEVMVAMCSKVEGTFGVEVAEAMAARQTLLIVIEAGLRNVIMEADNSKLYYHLKKGLKEKTSFGNIVGDIFHLAKQCSSIAFSLVRRSGNSVAQNLAHVSKKF